MPTTSKITRFQKILLSVLILANFLVGTYVLYPRQPEKPLTKFIPAADLIENTVVRKHLDNLMAQNQTQQIAVALLTSASTSCSTGEIVELFKKSARFSMSEKLVIILPNQFSQQDIENFKTNFDLNLKVERADDELSQQWLPLASKYEALGIVVISDSGKIAVLQETDEIEKHLAKFE